MVEQQQQLAGLLAFWPSGLATGLALSNLSKPHTINRRTHTLRLRAVARSRRSDSELDTRVANFDERLSEIDLPFKFEGLFALLVQVFPQTLISTTVHLAT